MISQQLPDRALLIDIGTGTRDIMLFSSQNSLENNSKIVAPTATRKLAARVAHAKQNLKIAGFTMGGGPLADAMCNHIRKGFSIEIEPLASFTVRNNLEQVEKAGFCICEKVDDPDIFFDEIEIKRLFEIFTGLGEDCSNIKMIGLSVQDHGDHGYDESSRKKRFELFLELLGDEPHLRSLIFNRKNLPENFSRMRSGLNCIDRHFPEIEIILMDTCISAVSGCFFDPKVDRTQGPMLIVNFGNGHTLACVVEGKKLLAIYEHHTGMIKKNPALLEDHLRRLVEGRLEFEEVFQTGGHGCKTFTAKSFADLSLIVATGPNRQISEKISFDFYQPSPGGDMMMTGPLGLLKGYEILKRREN